MPLKETRTCKLQRPRRHLAALVSEVVVTEVDVGDATVGLQGTCQCLSGQSVVEHLRVSLKQTWGRANRVRLDYIEVGVGDCKFDMNLYIRNHQNV